MADPFPTPFATLLADDPLMTDSLNASVEETLVEFPSLEQPLRTAISIAAVDDTVSPMGFQHGGLDFGRTYYSASLVKVGVMYAAFQLRKRVNDFIVETSPASPTELFEGLKASFDDTIAGAVPQVSGTAGITRDMKIPKYSQIFTAADLGSGLVANFTAPFKTNMFRMIVNSDNAAAGCVKALGYSWINGALKAGGFFFPDAEAGLWVGGTFTGALPPVKIPCVNDIDTAQGASTFDVANMYAHVLNGTLVDALSSTDFSAHLQTSAAGGFDPSFMDKTRRPGLPFRNFGVTHTKVGLGPLKDGRTVISEGTVVEHLTSGRKFIAVWQNTLDNDDSKFAMGAIVERTIEKFLAGP